MCSGSPPRASRRETFENEGGGSGRYPRRATANVDIVGELAEVDDEASGSEEKRCGDHLVAASACSSQALNFGRSRGSTMTSVEQT